MQDLWGEEIQTRPNKSPNKARAKPPVVPLSSQDCVIFGHTWGAPGFFGEKLCLVCGTKGYCPGCTPINPPADARPFLCTRHSEGSVQA
jgi:hypothetical protein